MASATGIGSGNIKSTLPASLRVLIVEDDTLMALGLRGQLEKLGHTALGPAATAAEAVECFHDEKPDLVLLDIRLDGADGLEVIGELLKRRKCPVIVVSAYAEAALIRRASDVGAYGYLIKPITTDALAAQIALAIARFRDAEHLTLEKQTLEKTLETRKLVERAKGILMKKLKIDEPEAHRSLQLESQKRRLTVGEVAKLVIENGG